jgi:serine/threonine protein kinase
MKTASIEFLRNKYRVISEIGSGTFSEVYKAQNTKTGRMVAVKVLKHRSRIFEVENLKEIQALKLLCMIIIIWYCFCF